MGLIRPLFVYFRSFLNEKTKYSTNLTLIDKSVDGVPPRGDRMEGAAESTELWRHPYTLRHKLFSQM